MSFCINIINIIWSNVFEQYIDYESNILLYNDKAKIKSLFYTWMYNNTNIGIQINYIHELFHNADMSGTCPANEG